MALSCTAVSCDEWREKLGAAKKACEEAKSHGFAKTASVPTAFPRVSAASGVTLLRSSAADQCSFRGERTHRLTSCQELPKLPHRLSRHICQRPKTTLGNCLLSRSVSFRTRGTMKLLAVSTGIRFNRFNRFQQRFVYYQTHHKSITTEATSTLTGV